GHLEVGNKMLVHLNLLSRPWIAGDSPFALFRLETSEPADFNVLSFLERSNDGLDETINHCFRFYFCQSGPRSNVVDNVCFGQCKSPFVVRTCSLRTYRGVSGELVPLCHPVLKQWLL